MSEKDGPAGGGDRAATGAGGAVSTAGGVSPAAAAVGARALEHDRHLSVDIGPRGTCTDGERRAAEYAKAELAKWAQGVKTQPFRCYSTYAWPWGLVAVMMVATGVLLWLVPVAAFVVALVSLAIYLAVASGRADVGFLFPKRPCQNVWGRVPRAGAPGPAVARRVVLMAHVDTTRAALLYAPKALKSLRGSHMVNLVSAVGLAVLGLVAAGSNWAVVNCGPTCPYLPLSTGVLLGSRILGSVLALIALYAGVMLIHRQVAMPYVHGANDNASGVGLTLALGEHYAKNPLANTEIWCVMTGAEESGYPAGSRKFVDAHLGELRDSEILVLDNLGAGDLRHLTAEGIILPMKMDPGLLALARRIGSGHPDWDVRDSVCNLGYTDATPALVRKLRTIALWAEGPDGFLKNYHWPTDVFENVEPETIRRAAAFVMEMIEAIDRGDDRGRCG